MSVNHDARSAPSQGAAPVEAGTWEGCPAHVTRDRSRSRAVSETDPAGGGVQCAGQTETSLPGPRSPVAFQTLQWLMGSPLVRFERLALRYGETFRLGLLTPRVRGDRTRLPLVRRTLVVVSAPAHLRDVYTHSSDQLRVGEMHEFAEWHLGSNSILLLDGERHIEERRLFTPLFSPSALVWYQQATRSAAARAFAGWPARGTVPLARLADDLALDCVLTVTFGRLDEVRLAQLRHLVRAGATATALSPLMMCFPAWRADLV